MSADNAYAVFEKGGSWYFAHVFMSPFDENCMYLADVDTDNRTSYRSEDDAVLAAYHTEKQEIAESGYGTEYGVFTAKIPEKPCGTCYVCVHERKIVSEDIEICDGCGKPITSEEWKVTNSNGTFHHNFTCEGTAPDTTIQNDKRLDERLGVYGFSERREYVMTMGNFTPIIHFFSMLSYFKWINGDNESGHIYDSYEQVDAVDYTKWVNSLPCVPTSQLDTIPVEERY